MIDNAREDVLGGAKKWNLEFKDRNLEDSYLSSNIKERKRYLFRSLALLHFVLVLNNITVVDLFSALEGDKIFVGIVYYTLTFFLCHLMIFLTYYFLWRESKFFTYMYPITLSSVRLFDSICTSYLFRFRRTHYWILLLFISYSTLTGSWKRKLFITNLATLQDYFLYYFFIDFIDWNYSPKTVIFKYLVTDIPILAVFSVVGYFLEKNDRERFFGRKAISRLEEAISKRNTSAAAVLENLMPSEITQKLVGVLEQSLKTGEEFSTLAMEECIEFHEKATIVFLRISKHRGRTILDELGVSESIVACAQVFKELDAVVDELGYTKVKTIMNRYMIFSNSDEVVEAIHLCRSLRSVAMTRGFTVQVGVVANAKITSGILGHRRLQWDVISNDVNFSYRLMASCDDNEIRFPSSMVKDFVSRDSRIARSCGEISLKGMGKREVSVIPPIEEPERIRNSLVNPRKASILEESLHISAMRLEPKYEIVSSTRLIGTKFKDIGIEEGFVKETRAYRNILNRSSTMICFLTATLSMVLQIAMGDDKRFVVTSYLPIPTLLFYIVLTNPYGVIGDSTSSFLLEIYEHIYVCMMFLWHGGNDKLVAETTGLFFRNIFSVLLSSRRSLYKFLICIPGMITPIFAAKGLFASLTMVEGPCFYLILILVQNNFDEMRRYFKIKLILQEKLKFVEAMESLLNDLMVCVFPQELLSDRRGEIRSYFIENTGGDMLLKNKAVLETFDYATVICLDFVDFTGYCSRGDAVDTFKTMNKLYGRFDRVCSTFEDVIPISTVGDCYVCLSLHCGSDADLKPLKVALGFQEEIELDTDSRLNARIGIACGTVTGGILLSRSRSVYELWGDVMVLAERMEEEDSPGFVRMTRKQAIVVGLKPDISDDDDESCGVNFPWSDIRALVG